MLGIQAPLLTTVPGVSHRFFSRIGGTSPKPWAMLNTSFDVGDSPARVQENLARVRFQIGVRKDALYSATQVHGTDVIVVRGDEDCEELRAAQADGIVTVAPHVAVAVRTADCAPILLAVDDGSGVGALHAGWRGAVHGMVQSGVAALCREAAVSASRLVAAIGPTIGMKAFEVGPEVIAAARAVSDIDGLWVPSSESARADRAHLDLSGFVERLLRQAGVERVERVGSCTVTHTDVYFSHRKEDGVTGRQMSVIARTEPPRLDDEALA